LLNVIVTIAIIYIDLRMIFKRLDWDPKRFFYVW